MVTLEDTTYSNMRGFNYQPSYAGAGIIIWSDFDAALVEQEIERGRKYFPGSGVLRLWLSFDAYIRDSKQFILNFQSALEIADRHGFRVIPVFFNNWHSVPDFGGISAEMVAYWNKDFFCHHFLGYVDALVKPCCTDPRIIMWDLCNEPFNAESTDAIEKIFVPWLQRLYDRCKELGATAPVTVGMTAAVEHLEYVLPMSDVLTTHIYYALGTWIESEHQFLSLMDSLVAFANRVQKALVVTETGWGSLDDQQRVEFMKVELHALVARNLGFCVHLLHHSLIADAHRADAGPVSEAGFMACINADGSLRAGHEIINNY